MLVLSRFDCCFNRGVIRAQRSSQRLDRANLGALDLPSKPSTHQRAVETVRLAPGSQAKTGFSHGSRDERSQCLGLCHLATDETIRTKIIQEPLAQSDKIGQAEAITPQPANFRRGADWGNRFQNRRTMQNTDTSVQEQAQVIEGLLTKLQAQLRAELFEANEVARYYMHELHLAHLTYLQVGIKQLRTALQEVAR